MYANNDLYFVGNLVTKIYTFSRSCSHLCMAGRKECFPSQFTLFPSFEYYPFCSAHKDTHKIAASSQIIFHSFMGLTTPCMFKF